MYHLFGIPRFRSGWSVFTPKPCFTITRNRDFCKMEIEIVSQKSRTIFDNIDSIYDKIHISQIGEKNAILDNKLSFQKYNSVNTKKAAIGFVLMICSSQSEYLIH